MLTSTVEFIYESTTTTLFACVVLLTLLYYYSTCTFHYWKERGVKYLKPLPFLGTAKNLIFRKKDRVTEFDELYKEYENERYVGMFTFRTPTLYVRDPDLIHAMMTTDFTNFVDRGLFTNEKIDKLSAHLLGLTGTRWRNLRQKLTPVFSSGKLKTMMDELKVCTEELETVLSVEAETRESTEMRDVMSKFAIRVIGSIAFGCQFNTLKDSYSEFLDRSQKLFIFSIRIIVVILLNSVSPKLRAFLGIKSMNEGNENFYLNFVKDTVSYREKNNVRRKDFLQLLIDLRKEDAAGASELLQNCSQERENHHDENSIILDDKLLASNVYMFFVAGYETTAATLSHCLLELAANPAIQRRLREETISIMEKNDNLTYDTIKDMTLLKNIILETLRKYPPIPILARSCTKMYRVPGSDVVMDAGVNISVPVYSIHMDPQYYPKPEVFDPDRFSEENKHNIRNGTYLPFGIGPRNCIGMRLAILVMKVALAYMISRYQFTLTNKMKYPVEFSARAIFLKPKDGVWLQIKKIENI